MRLIEFFLRTSPAGFWGVLLAGFMSGVFSVALLALLNAMLNRTLDLSAWASAGLFAAVLLGKVSTSAVSRMLLSRYGQQALLTISLALCRKLLHVPYSRLEGKGPSRMLVTMTDDVGALGWAIECVPGAVTNFAILVGCALYLAYLSWTAIVAGAIVVLLGGLGYHLLRHKAVSATEDMRMSRARLFHQFQVLIHGLKELIMHEGRRQAFDARVLVPAAESYRDAYLASTRYHVLSDGWSQIVFYGVIGLVVLTGPWGAGLPPASLTAYVVVLLYAMAPIWGVLNLVPTLTRGELALRSIQELGLFCDHEMLGQGDPLARPVSSRPTVELKGVSFQYESSDGSRGTEGSHFVLGPLDLVFRPGEVTFVAGGNGSGKTTLLKILVGLYQPISGELWCDGVHIDTEQLDWYRRHFAVVFAESYVFDRLLGVADSVSDEVIQEHLDRLCLSRIVKVKDAVFSRTALSQGQRKRLALLTALAEDRPVYVFDEWAAEQDPEYKTVFYTQLLPRLRAAGKTLVVITHDDRFFGAADRLIKLEEGQVVSGDVSVPGASTRPARVRPLPTRQSA